MSFMIQYPYVDYTIISVLGDGNLLRKARDILSLFAVISLVVIILAYLTNSKAKAPHPDGNFTAIDMSSVYSAMSDLMLLIMPYAVGSFFFAVVGIVVVSYKIKSCY